MTVFRNYNPQGEVNQNAHPVVQVYPWIPNKQMSPTGNTQRLVTTNERPSWFVRRGATPGVNPMSDCGCGGNSTGVNLGGKGSKK